MVLVVNVDDRVAQEDGEAVEAHGEDDVQHCGGGRAIGKGAGGGGREDSRMRGVGSTIGVMPTMELR